MMGMARQAAAAKNAGNKKFIRGGWASAGARCFICLYAYIVNSYSSDYTP